MTTPVKVYGPPGQPMAASVSRILTCLIEKEVPYELITVNMKTEPKKPQLLRTQSFGQVPAIEDESLSLFGSRAICRYIAEKYANQGNKDLYGTKPLEKASVDQWLEFEGQSFNPPISELVLLLAFGARKKSRQEEAVIKQDEAKLNKVLDIYERRLEESPYLAGEVFTLADLSHLPNTQFLVSATDRGKLFTSRKNVGRWWSDISGRESWKKVVAMQNSPPPPTA